MYTKLKFTVKIQHRDNIFKTIPPVFKSKFPYLTSIIDCFEVFIESHGALLARALCYSNYKKYCTIIVFISCTPLGAIFFLSKYWGGLATYTFVVRESGFCSIKFHMHGVQVFADQGFILKYDFAAGSYSELIIPAFTKNKGQLSADEV